MLNATNIRQVLAHVVEPVARGLLKLGLSPDAITIIGTIGVSFGALYFFPQGMLWQGVLVIVAFVFSDMLDGTMARLSGRSGPWGAFLDSTLDRVADGAIYIGLIVYAAREQNWWLLAGLATCLIAGTIISYAKARAEGLGMTCNVGFAERSERLIIILLVTLVAGFGVPHVLMAGVWILAALSVFTVFQRVLHVRKQAQALSAGSAEAIA